MSTRRLRDQGRNAGAVVALLARLRYARIQTILDIRYGRGGLARRVLGLFPRAAYYGVECDPATYADAWHPPGGAVVLGSYHGLADLPAGWPATYDLLLADFSDVTRRNRAQLDAAVAGQPARFLAFCDIAISKLHLHRRTYGLAPDGGLEDYWGMWDVAGYRLLSWIRAHGRASFGLFNRSTPEG